MEERDRRSGSGGRRSEIEGDDPVTGGSCRNSMGGGVQKR